MRTQPRFLQGVFTFTGQGYTTPVQLDTDLGYVAPFDRRAQLVYFRGGNAAPELIYIVLIRDDKPMRLFPLGAKSDSHVPLAVVEDLEPETRLQVFAAAPHGLSVTVVLDIGLVEV